MRRALRLCIALFALLSAAPAQAQTDRVEALLSQMTLRQKVGQMFMVGLYGQVLNEPGRDFLREWQPGAVALFVSNAGTPEQITRLTNSWQETVINAGGVPLFIATDQEGGIIARLKDGFTVWPVPMLLTASGDLEIAQRVGAGLANELTAVGVNMNLAPVADLYTNLRNPIIGRRSFGSDPVFTGRMLGATVRGLQAGGVLATAKHFPGHGDTDTDSHTELPVIHHPRESLSAIELEPFRWTIAAGVEAMMVAHIWYSAYDPDEVLPASLSYNVVTRLLRDELRFRGLIVTDAIEMDAIDTRYSYAQASIMAINAGVDMVAFGAHLNPRTQATAMQAVVDAVENGEIPMWRIDESVRRILDAKARYGVLDWTPLDPQTARDRMNTAAHQALVDEMFRAGVTIAYDRNGSIPLTPGQEVAIIYPGSRRAIRTHCEPLSDPARTRWLTFNDTPTPDQIQAAVTMARAADTVVVFTQNAGIINAQRQLVNALPQDKTVAVALFSPYDWQVFPDVSAYVTTYSPLDPGIPAVCDVLFGAQVARGQLPVALDGVRDFRESVVGVQRTAIPAIASAPTEAIDLAALPVVTIAPPVADPLPAQDTPPPPQSVEPTATREPLIALTRATAQGLGRLENTVTPTPAPPTEPMPAPPVVASAPAEPPTGNDTAPVIVIGLFAGVLAIGYAGLMAQGVAQANRYRGGFVIQRCPACGQATLKIRVRRERLAGIPRARYAVTCESCHSTLREEAPRRWRYRVNQNANPRLHQRLNNKLIDDQALALLEREQHA